MQADESNKSKKITCRTFEAGWEQAEPAIVDKTICCKYTRNLGGPSH